MKKLRKSIYISLPPVKLYLDDMRNIYDILKNNCKDVTIKTAEYQLSDVDQLKDVSSNEIHELHLVGKDPYISVNLEPNSTSIYVDEDSTLNVGILSEIKVILSKCQRKIARVFANPFLSSLVLMLVFFALLIPIGQFTEGLFDWILLGFLVLFYILSYVSAYRFQEYSYSTVVLSERREKGNFFVRNKDQILINLLVAVVTILLTILVMRLVP